jgi:hypothetical protein
MHPAERTQEVTHARPHPFDCVGVDFAHAVAIIVARPLVLPVRDGRMRPGRAGRKARLNMKMMTIRLIRKP